MAANTNNSSQESPVRQLRLVVEATNFEAALAFYKDVLGLPLLESFEVDDSEARTAELANAGATLIASPRETPWRSLNSRLHAPTDLEITLFQELDAPEAASAQPRSE